MTQRSAPSCYGPCHTPIRPMHDARDLPLRPMHDTLIRLMQRALRLFGEILCEGDAVLVL